MWAQIADQEAMLFGCVTTNVLLRAYLYAESIFCIRGLINWLKNTKNTKSGQYEPPDVRVDSQCVLAYFTAQVVCCVTGQYLDV